MSFTNLTFLFLFLPAALIPQLLIRKIWLRNTFLLIASTAFFVWADPGYLWVPIYFTAVLYIHGRMRTMLIRSARLKTLYQILFMILTVSPLVFYKYTGFIINNLNRIIDFELKWETHPLPLGLSFLTFTCLAYLIDINRGVAQPERNLLRLSNYVTFFPKLTQGPITRHSQLEKNLLERQPSLEKTASGIKRFILGFAKKIILADSLAVAGNRVFNLNPDDYGVWVALFGLISFGLQIYLDFSGYTDMAIGLGRIIGFELPENFDFPYWSRSISEFWRRWHITLNSWFRDYIFIPLERRRVNSKLITQPLNIFIVFLLTGIWHGASWNFVFWGILHGIVIIIESRGLSRRLAKLPGIFQHFYALGIIFASWIFFRLEDAGQWLKFFKALFGANGLSGVYTLRSLNILAYWPIILVSILICAPIKLPLGKEHPRSSVIQFAESIALVGLFLLGISLVVSRGYEAFLYQQF